jgi:hypothetical protein
MALRELGKPRCAYRKSDGNWHLPGRPHGTLPPLTPHLCSRAALLLKTTFYKTTVSRYCLTCAGSVCQSAKAPANAIVPQDPGGGAPAMQKRKHCDNSVGQAVPAVDVECNVVATMAAGMRSLGIDDPTPAVDVECNGVATMAAGMRSLGIDDRTRGEVREKPNDEAIALGMQRTASSGCGMRKHLQGDKEDIVTFFDEDDTLYRESGYSWSIKQRIEFTVPRLKKTLWLRFEHEVKMWGLVFNDWESFKNRMADIEETLPWEARRKKRKTGGGLSGNSTTSAT